MTNRFALRGQGRDRSAMSSALERAVKCASDGAREVLLARTTRSTRGPMGRILLGVVIGVILVIWLLASCVGAIF